LGGLEPPTKSLGNSCSFHLSYSRRREDYTLATAISKLPASSGIQLAGGLGWMLRCFFNDPGLSIRVSREGAATGSPLAPGRAWRSWAGGLDRIDRLAGVEGMGRPAARRLLAKIARWGFVPRALPGGGGQFDGPRPQEAGGGDRNRHGTPRYAGRAL